MSAARNVCVYGSIWDGGRRGILSNVVATGVIQWKCCPKCKKINQEQNIEVV